MILCSFHQLSYPPQKSDYVDWGVEVLANGLKTYALGTDVSSYRIITSYRLTASSCDLTGLFYQNSLKSVQKEKLSFEKVSHHEYFPIDGGTIIKTVVGTTDGICSKGARRLIHMIVDDISSNYTERSIGIISPFRQIDSKYQIVMSAKVVDELDKLKIQMNSNEKHNVETALRLIKAMDNPNVSMELSDPSLLPDDFNKKSPDNNILTVALKYKGENPILLTSDNGLSYTGIT